MKRISSVRLALLSGLLLVVTAACSDQPADDTLRAAVPPDFLPIVPVEVASTELETYTVQPGDFLSSIADRYDVTVEELAAQNNIVNSAVIEVGQVLEIPGAEVTSVDSFFVVYPAERYEDFYPLPHMPPPPPPTTWERFRERVAALPWPERQVNLLIATVGLFAVGALASWYIAAKVIHHGLRIAFRWVPVGARWALAVWAAAARQPRRFFYFIVPHSVRTWRVSVQVAQVIAAASAAAARFAAAASAAAWRFIRPLVAAAWAVTRPFILRAWEAVRPTLSAWAYTAWHGERPVNNNVPRTREEARANAHATRWLPGGRRPAEEHTPRGNWRSDSARELADAFEKKQLEVRYRPVIDLASKTLTAVEARLFWRHPARGLLSGKEIYPAADQHPELGRALLELIVESGSEFVGNTLHKRYPSAHLIVPLTRQQILESEPLAVIDWAISNAGLSLDRLTVSVEESHVLNDPHAASIFVRNVRAMGLAAQLDGYRALPAQHLKPLGANSVSADFADVGKSDAARQRIIEAVEAAQELRLPITAKHVRSDEARKLVGRLLCSFEAIGEPLTERAFISTYVDRKVEAQAAITRDDTATQPRPAPEEPRLTADEPATGTPSTPAGRPPVASAASEAVPASSTDDPEAEPSADLEAAPEMTSDDDEPAAVPTADEEHTAEQVA